MKPQTPGYRILVLPDKLEDFDPFVKAAKAAGIQLAEPTERKELTGVNTGVVVEVGPTAYEKESVPWCKAGDRVSYVRHGGMLVTNPDNKDEKWLVINDDDVVMVWSE